MKKGYVYILKNIHNHTYVGSTTRPLDRLHDHNSGFVVSTKNKGPWSMIFLEEFDTEHIAKKVESRLKKLKRRDIIEQIIKDGYIKLQVNGL